jgi:hypothetical protein
MRGTCLSNASRSAGDQNNPLIFFCHIELKRIICASNKIALPSA